MRFAFGANYFKAARFYYFCTTFTIQEPKEIPFTNSQ